MGISKPGVSDDTINGTRVDLRLRNGEIERFEHQYDPLGIYEVWDGLMGRGKAPQVRHIRDLVALGLVGAGMSDRAADDLVAGLGPEHNLELREVARRLLAVTFLPMIKSARKGKKKEAGSGGRNSTVTTASSATTSPAGSETSAE